MALEIISRDIYKKGDFKVALPENELIGLVERIKGIIDIGKAYQDFQLRGIGTLYYDAITDRVPVEVEVNRGSDGRVNVRFTHATPEGVRYLSDIEILLQEK